jgi:hypothetical protein
MDARFAGTETVEFNENDDGEFEVLNYDAAGGSEWLGRSVCLECDREVIR